jgi:hypothetical protein
MKLLKLVLRGNDLLNQNSGFTRSATSNLLHRGTGTLLSAGTYMLSVVWDFSGWAAVHLQRNK